MKRYLLEPSGAIVRDRYEFMVHRQLRDGLEAGDLHCRDSARFRSLTTIWSMTRPSDDRLQADAETAAMEEGRQWLVDRNAHLLI